MGVDFGDAEALESFGVVFAVKDVPLLAAFEDFLLLRADLGANFRIDLLLELQQCGENGDDFLADGVAVFDEINALAGNEKIDDAVGESNRLFAAQAHLNGESISFRGPAVP